MAPLRANMVWTDKEKLTIKLSLNKSKITHSKAHYLPNTVDPACKKTEWWGAGVVICLQRGADLHMAQLMPQPLTISCFSKIQIGFTFLVPADPGSPGKRAVKWV